ncbi:MAG: hypothetical protein U1C71_02640, partial [archaeon]|nr:hypothetical protein [archaeon]
EVRVFLPPSLEPQTIIVQNGVVEVRSTRAYASAPVMDTTWLGTGIADGNFFEAGKDEYGYFWMRGSS